MVNYPESFSSWPDIRECNSNYRFQLFLFQPSTAELWQKDRFTTFGKDRLHLHGQRWKYVKLHSSSRTSFLGSCWLGYQTPNPTKNRQLLWSCIPHHRFRVTCFYQGNFANEASKQKDPHATESRLPECRCDPLTFDFKLFVSDFYWKTIENTSLFHGVVHPFDSKGLFWANENETTINTHWSLICLWYLLPHPHHEDFFVKIMTFSFHYILPLYLRIS